MGLDPLVFLVGSGAADIGLDDMTSITLAFFDARCFGGAAVVGAVVVGVAIVGVAVAGEAASGGGDPFEAESKARASQTSTAVSRIRCVA